MWQETKSPPHPRLHPNHNVGRNPRLLTCPGRSSSETHTSRPKTAVRAREVETEQLSNQVHTTRTLGETWMFHGTDSLPQILVHPCESHKKQEPEPPWPTKHSLTVHVQVACWSCRWMAAAFVVIVWVTAQEGYADHLDGVGALDHLGWRALRVTSCASSSPSSSSLSCCLTFLTWPRLGRCQLCCC